MEKKILKTGPYRPKCEKEVQAPKPRDKDIIRNYNKEPKLHRAPPYILGYTGNI